MSSSAIYAANRSQQTWSKPHQLRKQRSLIENTSSVSNRILRETGDRNRGRGSGNRSGSLVLARLPSERNKFLYLQKQRSVVDQVCAGIRGRSEQRSRRYSLTSTGDKNSEIGDKCSGTRRIEGKDFLNDRVKLAWNNSSFDNNEYIRHQNNGSLINNKNDVSRRNFGTERVKKSVSGTSSKPDNKINLSIVLAQTIKATENETNNTDIDSSSESTDTVKKQIQQSDTKKSLPLNNNSKSLSQQESRRITSAAQRRAQFQSSRVEQLPTSPSSQTNPSTISTTLSASPSLTIQKRPPLVRAMSAPVRSLFDTTKNLLANSKRKTRRRKIISRNSSCDKGETEPLNSGVPIIGSKKILSRSKSVIASDVITLISLASSEGSDSEKEESISAEETQSSRAPSLRKTGKSVSFQESEQPNYQMVVKDFPHMLRRGSIAPLAARLRANRPPTAPPGSIFRSDFEICSVKMCDLNKIANKEDLATTQTGKENNVFIKSKALSVESNDDFVFPDYVRSNKERECWKLFQKMSKKGVTVTYDTILRGMLTPTEFRQLQKQRELEEQSKIEESENKESPVKSDK